jgi:hypothetical protein
MYSVCLWGSGSYGKHEVGIGTMKLRPSAKRFVAMTVDAKSARTRDQRAERPATGPFHE